MIAINSLLPAIAERLQVPSSMISANIVQGGSVNQCYKVQAGTDTYFCKVNNSHKYPGMFQAEMLGLNTIAASNTIRVPACRHIIETEELQCLLLEWIEPKHPSANFWRSFGESLAKLHSVENPFPGFHSDNYMGSLRQFNEARNSWSAFFVELRLMVQVSLAANNTLLGKSDLDLFDRLYSQLASLLPEESNVLLHGDLWSGNFLCNGYDQPVIFDPAVYYGSRHIDLAMTTLFGGFDSQFYEAYRYHAPLPSNYEEVWRVLNLYPLLVHLNLFGAAYRRPILDVLKHF